jgi:2-haloacid dehalogenase
MGDLKAVKSIAFDVGGTLLDIGESLNPDISQFLESEGKRLTPTRFQQQWRARQRIEQFQDTILLLGHSGYLETVRRALVYTLRLNQLKDSGHHVDNLMEAWQHLIPFDDVTYALNRLAGRYSLSILSNFDSTYLNHLIGNSLKCSFDSVFSTSTVGFFKPHPSVYRRAARIFGYEVGQCMMVSAHSFDVMGAQACGYCGAFVNRYELPYEDTAYQPDLTVMSLSELADILA